MDPEVYPSPRAHSIVLSLWETHMRVRNFTSRGPGQAGPRPLWSPASLTAASLLLS